MHVSLDQESMISRLHITPTSKLSDDQHAQIILHVSNLKLRVSWEDMMVMYYKSTRCERCGAVDYPKHEAIVSEAWKRELSQGEFMKGISESLDRCMTCNPEIEQMVLDLAKTIKECQSQP